MIEDNAGDVELIKAFLAQDRDAWIAIENVDRLSTALQRLAAENFDVVLLDLGLPDSQGLDTFRRVHARAPHRPIVILTGLDDGPLGYQAVREGAQDFLVKGEMNCRTLVRCLHYALERNRAEQALRNSELVYQALAESVPMHVFRKDLQGRFTFANKRFCDSLGLPWEQVLDKTDLDFYPRDLADKYRRDDQKVVSSGQLFEGVERHQLPNGERLYVEVFKTPLYDAQHRIIGIQAMFWDVTTSKWAEEQKSHLRMARTIQQNLLPTSPPRLPGFDFGGACYPAESVGGDFFDFIERDGSVRIVLGDVSGHGIGPALLAAVTHACLRTLSQIRPDFDIETVLATANRLLTEDIRDDQFVTLFFAHVDPLSRSLVYSGAGHPPGFLLDSCGAVKARLHSTGPVLGLLQDATFPMAPPVPLDLGEMVLFMSDGISEATAPDGTLFGTARAVELVRAHHRRSAQEIVEVLCRAALDFKGSKPCDDDITAVVIKAMSAS